MWGSVGRSSKKQFLMDLFTDTAAILNLLDLRSILDAKGALAWSGSALVNIRRKALGHLMKFTQGRLKYTWHQPQPKKGT